MMHVAEADLASNKCSKTSALHCACMQHARIEASFRSPAAPLLPLKQACSCSHALMSCHGGTLTPGPPQRPRHCMIADLSARLGVRPGCGSGWLVIGDVTCPSCSHCARKTPPTHLRSSSEYCLIQHGHLPNCPSQTCLVHMPHGEQDAGQRQQVMTVMQVSQVQMLQAHLHDGAPLVCKACSIP